MNNELAHESYVERYAQVQYYISSALFGSRSGYCIRSSYESVLRDIAYDTYISNEYETSYIEQAQGTYGRARSEALWSYNLLFSTSLVVSTLQ